MKSTSWVTVVSILILVHVSVKNIIKHGSELENLIEELEKFRSEEISNAENEIIKSHEHKNGRLHRRDLADAEISQLSLYNGRGCTVEGEIIEATNLKYFLICKKENNVMSYKEHVCQKGEVFNLTVNGCYPLIGNGDPKCVLRNRNCPDNMTGLFKHPNKDMFRNYIYCDTDLVILAECQSMWYFNEEQKTCVKEVEERNTTLIEINCKDIPLMKCTEPGVFPIETDTDSNDKNCTNCYYLCTDKDKSTFELSIICTGSNSTDSTDTTTVVTLPVFFNSTWTGNQNEIFLNATVPEELDTSEIYPNNSSIDSKTFTPLSKFTKNSNLESLIVTSPSTQTDHGQTNDLSQKTTTIGKEKISKPPEGVGGSENISSRTEEKRKYITPNGQVVGETNALKNENTVGEEHTSTENTQPRESAKPMTQSSHKYKNHTTSTELAQSSKLSEETSRNERELFTEGELEITQATKTTKIDSSDSVERSSGQITGVSKPLDNTTPSPDGTELPSKTGSKKQTITSEEPIESKPSKSTVEDGKVGEALPIKTSTLSKNDYSTTKEKSSEPMESAKPMTEVSKSTQTGTSRPIGEEGSGRTTKSTSLTKISQLTIDEGATFQEISVKTNSKISEDQRTTEGIVASETSTNLHKTKSSEDLTTGEEKGSEPIESAKPMTQVSHSTKTNTGTSQTPGALSTNNVGSRQSAESKRGEWSTAKTSQKTTVEGTNILSSNRMLDVSQITRTDEHPITGKEPSSELSVSVKPMTQEGKSTKQDELRTTTIRGTTLTATISNKGGESSGQITDVTESLEPKLPTSQLTKKGVTSTKNVEDSLATGGTKNRGTSKMPSHSVEKPHVNQSEKTIKLNKDITEGSLTTENVEHTMLDEKQSSEPVESAKPMTQDSQAGIDTANRKHLESSLATSSKRLTTTSKTPGFNVGESGESKTPTKMNTKENSFTASRGKKVTISEESSSEPIESAKPMTRDDHLTTKNDVKSTTPGDEEKEKLDRTMASPSGLESTIIENLSESYLTTVKSQKISIETTQSAIEKEEKKKTISDSSKAPQGGVEPKTTSLNQESRSSPKSSSGDDSTIKSNDESQPVESAKPMTQNEKSTTVKKDKEHSKSKESIEPITHVMPTTDTPITEEPVTEETESSQKEDSTVTQNEKSTTVRRDEEHSKSKESIEPITYVMPITEPPTVGTESSQKEDSSDSTIKSNEESQSMESAKPMTQDEKSTTVRRHAGHPGFGGSLEPITQVSETMEGQPGTETKHITSIETTQPAGSKNTDKITKFVSAKPSGEGVKPETTTPLSHETKSSPKESSEDSTMKSNEESQPVESAKPMTQEEKLTTVRKHVGHPEFGGSLEPITRVSETIKEKQPETNSLETTQPEVSKQKKVSSKSPEEEVVQQTTSLNQETENSPKGESSVSTIKSNEESQPAESLKPMTQVEESTTVTESEKNSKLEGSVELITQVNQTMKKEQPQRKSTDTNLIKTTQAAINEAGKDGTNKWVEKSKSPEDRDKLKTTTVVSQKTESAKPITQLEGSTTATREGSSKPDESVKPTTQVSQTIKAEHPGAEETQPAISEDRKERTNELVEPSKSSEEVKKQTTISLNQKPKITPKERSSDSTSNEDSQPVESAKPMTQAEKSTTVRKHEETSKPEGSVESITQVSEMMKGQSETTPRRANSNEATTQSAINEGEKKRTTSDSSKPPEVGVESRKTTTASTGVNQEAGGSLEVTNSDSTIKSSDESQPVESAKPMTQFEKSTTARREGSSESDKSVKPGAQENLTKKDERPATSRTQPTINEDKKERTNELLKSSKAPDEGSESRTTIVSSAVRKEIEGSLEVTSSDSTVKNTESQPVESAKPMTHFEVSTTVKRKETTKADQSIKPTTQLSQTIKDEHQGARGTQPAISQESKGSPNESVELSQYPENKVEQQTTNSFNQVTERSSKPSRSDSTVKSNEESQPVESAKPITQGEETTTARKDGGHSEYEVSVEPSKSPEEGVESGATTALNPKTEGLPKTTSSDSTIGNNEQESPTINEKEETKMTKSPGRGEPNDSTVNSNEESQPVESAKPMTQEEKSTTATKKEERSESDGSLEPSKSPVDEVKSKATTELNQETKSLPKTTSSDSTIGNNKQESPIINKEEEKTEMTKAPGRGIESGGSTVKSNEESQPVESAKPMTQEEKSTTARKNEGRSESDGSVESSKSPVDKVQSGATTELTQETKGLPTTTSSDSTIGNNEQESSTINKEEKKSEMTKDPGGGIELGGSTVKSNEESQPVKSAKPMTQKEKSTTARKNEERSESDGSVESSKSPVDKVESGATTELTQETKGLPKTTSSDSTIGNNKQELPTINKEEKKSEMTKDPGGGIESGGSTVKSNEESQPVESAKPMTQEKKSTTARKNEERSESDGSVESSKSPVDKVESGATTELTQETKGLPKTTSSDSTIGNNEQELPTINKEEKKSEMTKDPGGGIESGGSTVKSNKESQPVESAKPMTQEEKSTTARKNKERSESDGLVESSKSPVDKVQTGATTELTQETKGLPKTTSSDSTIGNNEQQSPTINKEEKKTKITTSPGGGVESGDSTVKNNEESQPVESAKPMTQKEKSTTARKNERRSESVGSVKPSKSPVDEVESGTTTELNQETKGLPKTTSSHSTIGNNKQESPVINKKVEIKMTKPPGEGVESGDSTVKSNEKSQPVESAKPMTQVEESTTARRENSSESVKPSKQMSETIKEEEPKAGGTYSLRTTNQPTRSDEDKNKSKISKSPTEEEKLRTTTVSSTRREKIEGSAETTGGDSTIIKSNEGESQPQESAKPMTQMSGATVGMGVTKQNKETEYEEQSTMWSKLPEIQNKMSTTSRDFQPVKSLTQMTPASEIPRITTRTPELIMDDENIDQHAKPACMSKNRKCPGLGYFRHNGSCTEYYECYFSYRCMKIMPTEVYKCPNCLKFNAMQMRCDLPENVPECTYLNFRLHPHFLLNFNFKQHYCTGPGKFVVPENCHQYYNCRKNVFGGFALTVRKCKQSQVFNETLKKCVPSEDKKCRQHNLSCPLANRYVGDLHDCSKFYTCSKNKLLQLYCPLDSVFNGFGCQSKTTSDLCNWEELKNRLHVVRNSTYL